jgi:hypothetical protein
MESTELVWVGKAMTDADGIAYVEPPTPGGLGAHSYDSVEHMFVMRALTLRAMPAGLHADGSALSGGAALRLYWAAPVAGVSPTADIRDVKFDCQRLCDDPVKNSPVMAGGWQYGVHLTRANDAMIDRCYFRGNTSSDHAKQGMTHGIHIETGDYACGFNVNNCKLYDWAVAVYDTNVPAPQPLGGMNNLVVSNCFIAMCGIGIKAVNISPYAGEAMQFINNQIDCASHGIWSECGAQVIGNFFYEHQYLWAEAPVAMGAVKSFSRSPVDLCFISDYPYKINKVA